MEEIRSVDGTLLGYTLPPEFEKLNKLIEMQSLSGKTLGFLLHPELKKIKGLIELQNIAGITSGYMLPPEVENLNRVLIQFSRIYKYQYNENLKEAITKIQSIVNSIQQEKGVDTQEISQNLSKISNDLDNSKSLSLDQILGVITLLSTIFFGLISSYPTIKDIYKDFNYDPIVEICGVITELEKEAVKFAEVNHQGGTLLYKYPKGKKSEYYLPESTQVCMLTPPKGNAKRIKVIFQLENHKQITGYVDRNKIKRLYTNK